jgi:hypothetical protein
MDAAILAGRSDGLLEAEAGSAFKMCVKTKSGLARWTGTREGEEIGEMTRVFVPKLAIMTPLPCRIKTPLPLEMAWRRIRAQRHGDIGKTRCMTCIRLARQGVCCDRYTNDHEFREILPVLVVQWG